MHVEKYKGAGVAPVSNHNARVYESRGYRRENIDSSLSGENYRLGPDRGPAKEWVNARVAALGLKRRPRSDAVLMCEWVVTLPESERGGEREFFEAAYDAMAARYGADNVVSCWVHRDEPGARPHMHFDWVPVTRDGRLSAKEVLSRKELLAVHRDLGRELSQALGHEVHLLLPSEERGRRELSRLNDRQYRDAMAERERASAMAASAAERAAAAEGARRAAEEAQRAAEDARDAERARLEAQREYGARLARAFGDAEGRRADLDRQVARLAQERDGMQAQADEAMASQVAEASKLRGLRDEVAKKQVVAADLAAEIEKKTAEKAEIAAQISDFSQKADAAQDRLECLQRGVEDAESLAAAGLGEVRRVAVEGGWAGGREQAAQAENQELRGRLASLEGESRELGERVAALEEEAQGAGDGLGALEGERHELGGRVRGLGARKERLGREVEQLEERVQGLERRAGQLRGLLDRARARLDGLAERLAGVLTSAPDLARRLRPDSVELLRSWGMLPQPQRRRGFGRAR